MTALIDGMLALSRSGRQELNVQWVELQAVVRQAQQDVDEEFGHPPVIWEIPDLPQVQADPVLLQQVMTNVLSNAVKYSQTRERPRVCVSVSERERDWLIVVRDNGVGFEPAYGEKLFGLFQRLHQEGAHESRNRISR